MAEGTPIGALAVRIGADANDLIDGLKKADKALGKTAEHFAVGVKAAGHFAAAAAAAGAAVFALVNKVADAADQLGKLSQKVGVSVESLSALKHAAALSDVSLEQLGTGLKQLSKFMVENGMAGESVEEQLLKIADQFSKSADGAGKTAAAMKMFGKSGADLIPLLNQGRAGIEEMRKEAERLGLIISTQAAKDAEIFNDNITKLKGSVEGLTIQLAGPFVKALGDATTAMLEAQKRGESFFEVMAAGLRQMFTGDDAHKWNVEIVRATDNLLKAENAFLAVKRGAESPNAKLFPEEAAATVEKYRKQLEAARAEVQRLMGIKLILTPEQPGGTAGGGGDKPPMPLAPDEKALDDARKAYLKLFEIEQEAVRLGQEFTAEEHKKKLEEEQRLQDERNRILIEAYDREQEEAIRQGQVLLEIERTKNEQMLRDGYRHRQLDMASAKTFFGGMAALMNTNSRKLFQIGKAAAIAETAVNTYSGAMAAYKALAGIPIVGPALGAAAAAAVVATGLSAIQNIRAQEFGGGSGAVPTFAASPVTGQPVGQPGGDVGGGGRSTTTIIKGLRPDDLFTGSQIRKLLEGLNDQTENGGRLVFT